MYINQASVRYAGYTFTRVPTRHAEGLADKNVEQKIRVVR